MIDRKVFFDAVRKALGALNQPQVDGFTAVLDEFERRRHQVSIPDLAYMLATAWWETGKTMQPVREAFYIGDFAKAEAWRKRNLRYYPFYGRGLVQLTWERNYRLAGQKLGQNFVNNPDLVMRTDLAVKIMFEGMIEGWFTGKALDDYIDDVDESDAEDLREYANARRIINGTDKASTVAGLALTFEKALRAADKPAPEVTAPAVAPAPQPDADPAPPVPGGIAGPVLVFAGIIVAVLVAAFLISRPG